MKTLEQPHIFKIDDLILYDNEKFIYKVIKTEDITYKPNPDGFTKDKYGNYGYQGLYMIWYKNISIFNLENKKVRKTEMTRFAANYDCKLVTKDLINNFVERLYNIKSEIL